MTKSVGCSLLAPACLWALPLAGGAQTTAPVPRTIVVTRAAFATDPSTLEMTVPVREAVIFSQLPS